MRERQGWVVAAVLLVLGAVAGAGSVREHWLPCRGSMLSGSILHGYAYGPDFGDACLRAMDGFSVGWLDGAGPWRPEAVLGLLCVVLLASAWTVVVLTSPWSRSTRLLAGAPALLSAAAGMIPVFGGGSDVVDAAYFWLLVAVDVAAVVAFVAIGIREEPGRRTMGQVALALGASTAVSFFPMMADYILMTGLSDASWDAPPGTGYPTVVAVALMAAVLLVVTLRPRPLEAAPAEDLVLTTG